MSSAEVESPVTPARRETRIARASPKTLDHEDPALFESFKKIFDTRPDSPSDGVNASLANLASTIESLFCEDKPKSIQDTSHLYPSALCSLPQVPSFVTSPALYSSPALWSPPGPQPASAPAPSAPAPAPPAPATPDPAALTLTMPMPPSMLMPPAMPPLPPRQQPQSMLPPMPPPSAQQRTTQIQGLWQAYLPPMAQTPVYAPTMAPAVPFAAAPSMAPAAAPAAAAPFSRGSLASMAQEQEGSRLLQQHLRSLPPPELAEAVDELAPHLGALSTNAFGNYLVSAMACLPQAHHAIHMALTGAVCRLMQHPQGSRVCQSALQRLPPPIVHKLVDELEGRVAEVACGTHGSWSVIAAYKHSRRAFILTELANQLAFLATHQNGSRVAQRVLLEAASVGADLSAAVEALLALGPVAMAALAQDRFGNYVVQIAMRHAPSPPQRARLIDVLIPEFHTLAVGKCGSNVAEVLIEHASPVQLVAVRSALRPPDVEALRTHMYGSYVMTALESRLAWAQPA